MTKGKVVLLVEPSWFWNTACAHVLSPRCRCLFQATIHDCGQLPSCVRLLGAPCVAHLESAPVRREVWWFAGPTSDSLARQRAHPCGGRMAYAQEWCRSGWANHFGSLQELLLGLNFWQFGLQFPRQKQGVCVTALLTPGRFCPRHWHPSFTAEVIGTKDQSWRPQQKAWIQFRTGTTRGVGTNAEEQNRCGRVWCKDL